MRSIGAPSCAACKKRTNESGAASDSKPSRPYEPTGPALSSLLSREPRSSSEQQAAASRRTDLPDSKQQQQADGRAQRA